MKISTGKYFSLLTKERETWSKNYNEIKENDIWSLTMGKIKLGKILTQGKGNFSCEDFQW